MTEKVTTTRGFVRFTIELDRDQFTVSLAWENSANKRRDSSTSQFGRLDLAIECFGHLLYQHGLEGAAYVREATDLREAEQWEPIPVHANW